MLIRTDSVHYYSSGYCTCRSVFSILPAVSVLSIYISIHAYYLKYQQQVDDCDIFIPFWRSTNGIETQNNINFSHFTFASSELTLQCSCKYNHPEYPCSRTFEIGH